MKKLKFLAALAVALLSASCSHQDEPGIPELTKAESFVGNYHGTESLTIGGAFTYTADIDVTVTAEGETLTVHYPGYSLAGTMMGDLTLGELTIDDLKWDEEKGGFYRNYGGQGLTRHFKAEQGGATTMDADYPLNDPSTILVTVDENGSLHIEAPFKLGAMPLPLTSAFIGTKK